MSDQKVIDSVFILIIGTLGLIFSGISVTTLTKVTSECESSFIRNGWTGILCVGACMAITAIMFFSCILSQNCYTETGVKRNEISYLAGMLVLSIISIVICTFMMKKYKEIEDDSQYEECGKNPGQTNVIIILALSSIIFLGSIIGISLLAKKEKKENEEFSKDAEEKEKKEKQSWIPFNLD